MIVSMKKASFIIQRKDNEKALSDLRELGLLHVEHQRYPAGKDIGSIKDDMTMIDKVITILSSPDFNGKSGLPGIRSLKDWRFTAKHILDTYARIDHLEEYSRSLNGQIAEWEGWGDFDPDKVKALRGKSIFIKLYQINQKELDTLPKDVVAKVVYRAKGIAFTVVVSREDKNLPYNQAQLPKLGLNQMRSRFSEDREIIFILREMIRKYTCYLGRFIEIRKSFAKELEFHEALRGMGSAGDLSYIVGYIPSEKAGNVAALSKEKSWGLLLTEPAEGDNVPTLVRNPRWVSIISPVFKLLEIVPGYHEMDISPVFLLFLSLFFGMIIGDAGYGMIYILITFLVQKKFGKKIKDHKAFFLFYLFSASAVLWGVITGTIFGHEWYVASGFKVLVPALNDTKFLQAFCFFIGALHLTIAQAWQAVKKFPSLKVLADAGWILILWSAFFLACMLILNDPLPGFVKWLLIAGSTLVLLFTSPNINSLKMISAGLGAIALNIMNNFTDVVSYVRLFAVGLAGVAISDTVNSLAVNLSDGNLPIHFIIVFLGHTINIILGPMSVLVHGIRLNVLEFSGHAGLSWSGTQYKPLTKTD